MSDSTPTDTYQTTGYDVPASARRTDAVGVTVAVLLLTVAAIGIGGGTWWLVPNLLPWIVAGVAALVGLGLIITSLPRRQRR